MKIEFSNEEYKALLDMINIADWVMTSHLDEPNAKLMPYTALRKKVISNVAEMGMDDLFEYDKKHDEYYESQAYEMALQEEFIEPYDGEVFWDELVSGLSERDLVHTMGKAEYENMDGLKRVEKILEIEEKYNVLFEKSGLNCINVQDSSATTSKVGRNKQKTK